jgi:hypothetical protein
MARPVVCKYNYAAQYMVSSGIPLIGATNSEQICKMTPTLCEVRRHSPYKCGVI